MVKDGRKPKLIIFGDARRDFVAEAVEDFTKFAEGRFSFVPFHLGKNKKIMVEFAHPNTHKLFHIGHLRNISIGESLVRILETTGNNIVRSNYQGDVGLHIAKCLWFIKHNEKQYEKLKKRSINLKIAFLGEAYSKGQAAYDEDEYAKKEIIEINRMIYDQDPKIMPLWNETRKWSLKYFENVYQRVDTEFNHYFFESQFYKRGIEICRDAEKKGILKISKGALIFDGKPYRLDIRVFINSEGFPTYEGKELALAEKEFSEFGELDKCIHVVTPEQKSFFQVTFKVEELLDTKKYKNRQYHLAYEWVRLKGGKMSSRMGNVIEGPWLIDKVKEKILQKYKCDEETAEIIAVAAVKYSFLKNDVFAQIAFDLNESVSMDGNSGPYLLYSYVRTQGILKKANTPTSFSAPKLNEEEKSLLNAINQYEEIVYKAAHEFAPNLIANYLFDLAQKFNLFYQKHQIIKTEKGSKNFRLTLTKAVGEVIKNGLYLLGIKTVEKM